MSAKPVMLPGLCNGRCQCPHCVVEDLELEAKQDRLVLAAARPDPTLIEPPYASYVTKPNHVHLRPMGDVNLWNDEELEF